MAEALDRQAVGRWLSDQQAAQACIARERVAALVVLTPEESLNLYLKLYEPFAQRGPTTPSPLLWAMRGALAAVTMKTAP